MPEIKLVHVTHVGGDVYALRPFHVPVHPDQGLPAGPDNTLPVPLPGAPDNSLPGVPDQPPPSPDNSLPVNPGIWPPQPPPTGFILAYIPGVGWKYVKLGVAPGQPLPVPPGGMPGTPTHPIAPGGPPVAPSQPIAPTPAPKS